MTNHAELITELEKATEGSRELDSKIHLTRRSVLKSLRLTLAILATRNLHFLEDGNIGIWKKDKSSVNYVDNVPNYTTRLDAALTLVPEGWGWLVEVWQREESWAQIVRRPKGSIQPSGVFEGAEAKTPALALCIAALKARAASDASATPDDRKSAPLPT